MSTATTRPLLMMTTRWQVCDTSGRMCVLRMIVWSPASSLMSSRVSMICFGIEAGRRLVENQDVRVVDDGLREADALPVSFGQLGALTVRHVGDARALHHLLDASRPLAGGHAFDLGDEPEILEDAHVGVERRRLRQVAGAALGLDRLVEDVEPGDNGFAFGGRHVAGQDAHRRRLAGAVGSEEPENLAALDPEADVVDRGDAAVAFREVLNLDHKELLFLRVANQKS